MMDRILSRLFSTDQISEKFFIFETNPNATLYIIIEFGLYRIDNLKFNDNIKLCCEER